LIQKGHELVARRGENGPGQILLAGKVVVKTPLLHPNRINEVADGNGIKSLGVEKLSSGPENFLSGYSPLVPHRRTPGKTNVRYVYYKRSLLCQGLHLNIMFHPVWLLHQRAVTSVIIGARRPDQLKDNILGVVRGRTCPSA
jgi:hypothetical protein